MQKAIKTLEKRIESLNAELLKVQKSIDEPEMLAEYEFAKNDEANILLEIIEHEQAIKKLITNI